MSKREVNKIHLPGDYYTVLSRWVLNVAPYADVSSRKSIVEAIAGFYDIDRDKTPSEWEAGGSLRVASTVLSDDLRKEVNDLYQKIYDGTAESLRPTSIHSFIGILSFDP